MEGHRPVLQERRGGEWTAGPGQVLNPPWASLSRPIRCWVGLHTPQAPLVPLSQMSTMPAEHLNTFRPPCLFPVTPASTPALPASPQPSSSSWGSSSLFCLLPSSGCCDITSSGASATSGSRASKPSAKSGRGQGPRTHTGAGPGRRRGMRWPCVGPPQLCALVPCGVSKSLSLSRPQSPFKWDLKRIRAV